MFSFFLWRYGVVYVSECVESLHEIQTGSLVDLSSAEVHDCCTPTPIVYNNVFQCIHDIGGLCTDGDYPAPTEKCSNDSCSAAAQVRLMNIEYMYNSSVLCICLVPGKRMGFGK